MVASIIRAGFAHADREHVEEEFREVTTMLTRSLPEIAAMLVTARPDVLAFAAYPGRLRRQIWSTNSLERGSEETMRRTDIVGASPTPPPCCA